MQLQMVSKKSFVKISKKKNHKKQNFAIHGRFSLCGSDSCVQKINL